MKKILPLLCIVLAMGACQNKPTETLWQNAQWADSVLIDTASNHCSAKVSLSIDYPTGGCEALTDSINTWLCEQLGDSTHQYLADIPGLLKHVGFSRLEHDEAEIRDCISTDADGGYALEYTYEREGKVIYEDSLYITLSLRCYQYTGGVHGSSDYFAATFRKAGGHRMDWDLLEGMNEKEIRQAIIRGLYKYFEVDNEADLRDNLMLLVEDTADGSDPALDEVLPLPQAAPFLTKEGVQVIYQQYEIACYAAGMPQCVVR